MFEINLYDEFQNPLQIIFQTSIYSQNYCQS